MIVYPSSGRYFAANFPGAEPGSSLIMFQRVADGFVVVPPPAIDWADYEEQPDMEIPQPDDTEGNPVAPLLQPQPPIRHPRDPWSYYQQAHGIAEDQPTLEDVLSWIPPAPEIPEQTPLTDVDRARQYAEAYAAAEQIIFLLMGRVAPALVVGGFFSPETVNAEGTRFMAFHRDLIIDFKNSGRHPDAGTLLYNAIASNPSRTAFPWLSANGEAILQIFATGLPRNA